MSSRVTSRIVIAVGLAAVFAAGVSVIMLEGQHQTPASAAAAASRAATDLGPQDESAVARNATAMPATTPAAPPAVAPPAAPPVPPSPGPQGQ